MRNLQLKSLLLLTAFSFVLVFKSFSQLPGSIIRQATSVAGRAVLDPDGNVFTSATTAGFGNNDNLNSELQFASLKAYPIEPYSDLRRGPNHSFSDYVPDSAGNGVYYRFSAAQQVMFRMRLGSIVAGSKGYSILMDTDGKFGATGANADPNYQASTTGTNGNPGFEIEIVLETNFRIAIYNVDSTSNPVLVKQYTNWQDMSQVSIASSNDNGDPDFLIDFYIPFSDLQAAPFNLTAASPIRFSATTVMAPKAAIGGPRSDIYGVAGNNYEDFIDAQPTCSIFNNPSTCPTAMCTAAPTINNPISTGTVNISGTWTKSVLSGAASTANITVYKNGISVGTINNVSSSSTWTLNNIALANADVITAKAIAASPAVESMCLTSNAVVASACNSSNRPATPILTCSTGSKGLDGTNLSTGWRVHVDNMTRNVFDNSVSNTTGLFGTQTGSSPNITWTFSGGCSSGAPLTSGSYKIYYTNIATGCVSLPAYFCADGNGNGNVLAGTLTVPTITSPSNASFTTATKSITGSTDPNATVYLYVNGTNTQTVTASAGGAFTFSNLNLLVGQQLYIGVELNTGSVGTSKCANQTPLYTVTCFTQTPLINADNNSQITAGAPITGTSNDVAGTSIKVYTSTSTLVATTSVQANGTWSTGNAGTTPSLYNAVAATIYYANAQNGSCGVSSNSASYTAAAGTSAGRCGTISGPVAAAASTISGTLTGSFTTTTVNLYLDEELIGTTTTTNTAWGPITVNSTATNTLYANGVLRIGIQESAKQEVSCPSSSLTILCTPTPTAPVYTLSSNSVNQNQSITCTITNVTSGSFYALADSLTGKSYGQGKWATSNANLTLTTDAFTSPGTYKIKVNASSLSGVNVCSSVSASSNVVVNSVLPLLLIEFKGKKQDASNLLEWITENEINSKNFEIERSSNGMLFSLIATVDAKGNNTSRNAYYFIDKNFSSVTNYYRLRIVDNDGKYTYSNVVAFKDAKAQDVFVSEVSPNPFSDKINITVSTLQAAKIKLSLIDVTGRTIYVKFIEGKKGSNSIEWNGIGSLDTGVYYLRVEVAGSLITKKVLKVK